MRERVREIVETERVTEGERERQRERKSKRKRRKGEIG